MLIFEKKDFMKTRTYFFGAILVLSAFSLNSCSSEGESMSADGEKETEQSCFYAYNEGTTEFEWTAYKTNDKIGVPGGFNEIEVTSDKAENPKDVIESIQFSMSTSSVETNNEERNGKVAEHFFGTINTEKITGGIKSLKEDGKAIVEVVMNSVTFDVEGDYTLEDGKFAFEATIDVGNWNALSGIEALNTICKDLHTGEDGVSKLWSEVALKLTTSLSSDCD